MADHSNSLKSALEAMLQQVCFVLPEHTFKGQGTKLPLEARGNVEFRGPISGHVELRIHGQALTQLARDMAGTDLISREEELDAMAELTNILCGLSLPLIFGSDQMFDLLPPDVTRRSDISEGSAVAEAEVSLDSACIAARIVIYQT